MSFLAKLIGGSVAQPIEAIGNIIDKLYTTDGEKLDKQAINERILQQPRMVQAEINKVEAASRSVFVAGWRPFIGWVCGVCIALCFISQFIVGTYLWVKMCFIQNALLTYPVNISQLMVLVTSLLGLGLYRTVEKFGGKTK